MYYHIETSTVLRDHSAIRAHLTNVLFPEAITAQMLDYHGVVELVGADPDFDASTHSAAPAPPAEVDGVWTQQWTITALSIDQIAATYLVTVHAHINRVAVGMGYDSMAIAVTYAEEPAVPRFQAEGRALRAWRSLVWDACYAMLAEVRAGTRAIPTEAEVLAALPVAPMQVAP